MSAAIQVSPLAGWLASGIETEMTSHRDEFFRGESCSCGWRAKRGPGGPQFQRHVAEAIARFVQSENAASRGLLW